MTAVAKNQFGKGTVYYVGTDLSESGLAKVLAMAADSAALQPVIGEATALEITKRQADGEDLYFIINFKDEEIPLPAVFDGKEDILTGEKVQGGEMLKKYRSSGDMGDQEEELPEGGVQTSLLQPDDFRKTGGASEKDTAGGRKILPAVSF